MSRYILAIDQGTTSSRAIVFDENGLAVAKSQQEFEQYFPNDGWVEHDPEDIWESTVAVCKEVIKKVGEGASDIESIGITNQRETTCVWNRETGKPIYKAIVWQDRRTAAFCKELKEKNIEPLISEKTGLLADPYFSASKIRWILDNVEGARELADEGKLAFGTIDTFLLWRLTGGKQHATDATNASRTAIFNIHTQEWDQELLEIFDVPESVLPDVRDSSDDFGVTDTSLFEKAIPINGMIGDQQAALVGQACFEKGMVKSTYGTGCFMVLNTGDKAVKSKNRLLTTVGYRIDGKVNYALEGSIFVAGAAIQWLRDGVNLIAHASETQALAEAAGKGNSVYMVPAFTGLGAPYWDPNARGAIFGLTRDTGIAEIVTAGLQSVCYQTKDLLEAMGNDGVQAEQLRVDGGMVVNDWVVQFLSDILQVSVDRPVVTETTALGAAFMAGLKSGVFENLESISELWAIDKSFSPELSLDDSSLLYKGWQKAVEKVLSS